MSSNPLPFLVAFGLLGILFSQIGCQTPSREADSPSPKSSPNATNPQNQKSSKPDTRKFTKIVTGLGHACVLDNQRRVLCTTPMYTSGDERPNAPDDQFVDIAAGGSFSCGIRTDHRIVCWGYVPFGWGNVPFGNLKKTQGDTGVLPRKEPRRSPPGRFRQIDAHISTLCAINVDGEPTCWGGGGGELFIMPMKPHLTDISVGLHHVCGITKSGTVECWGDTELGQSEAASGSFTSIDVGDYSSWAVSSSGSLRCWGVWPYTANQPCSPPDGVYRDIVAGKNHACGVKEDGRLTCWGPGENDNDEFPSGRVISIDANKEGWCAILESGEPYCWGWWPKTKPFGPDESE